jgi:hypothetical protein
MRLKEVPSKAKGQIDGLSFQSKIIINSFQLGHIMANRPILVS